MAARVCSECGGLVASSLTVCPHCGHVLGCEMNRGQSSGNAYGCGAATGYRPNSPIGNPYNSIGWIVVAFFLCWPLAIVALIYYFKSDQEWSNGNEAGARYLGELSVKWSRASLWFLAILLGLIILPGLITLLCV